MLKLIIADDERIIRETISKLIPWETLNIQLIGLCQNGLEAYDMIIDESPDIVLTDIKMPGMSGLELIKRSFEASPDTHFLILSGYGEFEYAKEAMQYGVRHYVLKPCNEVQLLDCIKEISKDCYIQKHTKDLESSLYSLTNNMHHNIISSIISESMEQKKSYSEIMQTYEPYIDFYGSAYQLFYIYFLEIESLETFLQELQQYCNCFLPQITLHGIYVNNTLLLFFQSYAASYEDFKRYIKQFTSKAQHVTLELQPEAYSNLNDLLYVILDKLKRFSMIYYINNFHILHTCNYSYFIVKADNLYQQLKEGVETAFDELTKLLSGIDDILFLKQLSTSLLLKTVADNHSLSTLNLTEWLIAIDSEVELESLKALIILKLKTLFLSSSQESTYSTMIEQIFDYVKHNLQEPNLTLKSIAENHLFMNVDYVSKRFFRETGNKFSNYLTDLRIQKAKELLVEGDSEKIQSVAEQVGCGNNPQYFSQIFKKNTGMTPSAYIKMIHGGL